MTNRSTNLEQGLTAPTPPPPEMRVYPVSVSLPADSQIIDYAVLAQLKEDISEEIYPELLKLFLDQGAERVDNITQAMANGDLTRLASEIHSFKSESATFGAIKLAALADHINLLCSQGDKAGAFVAAAAIKENWLLVCRALQP